MVATTTGRDEHSESTGKAGFVIDHLLRLISEGMTAHDKLPTERELAAKHGFSRLTVRRAIGELETEGLVYRVQGAGTFVSPSRITKSLELTSFSEDMRARGMVPGSSRISATRTAAGARLGYLLHLPPSAEVTHIHRTRTADNIPMCVENAYFNANFLPSDVELSPTSSLYDYLSGRGATAQPHRADQRIQATVLSEDEAAALEVPPFSPALVVERVMFNVRDEPMEFARSVYRADRYDYEVSIERASRAGLLGRGALQEDHRY